MCLATSARIEGDQREPQTQHVHMMKLREIIQSGSRPHGVAVGDVWGLGAKVSGWLLLGLLGLGGAPMVYGGVGSIVPMESMTATGDAGMITEINGIPVSALILGETSFPMIPKWASHPPENADNFDLNLVASADDQPYFEVRFSQAVTVIYLFDHSGNDEGAVQALDAAGDPIGDSVSFDPSSFWISPYQTGFPQIAAGMVIRMTEPVFGIRVFAPEAGVMGFDPVSVSGRVPPASYLLKWERDPDSGAWLMVWDDRTLILQTRPETGVPWTDLPEATSPYPASVEGEQQFFRLRNADAQ